MELSIVIPVLNEGETAVLDGQAPRACLRRPHVLLRAAAHLCRRQNRQPPVAPHSRMSTVQILSQPRPVAMADRWFEISGIDHFWIEWRFDALKKYLDILPAASEPILEVGCGHGVFRQQLEEQLGYVVDGCDLNMAALQMAVPGRGRLLVYDIHDRNPDLLGCYSAVFLMDVVEHVDDDPGFLRSAAAHAKPGAIVVINVPAHPWLYSKYDEEAGHVRRYSRRTMRALIGQAGLQPVAVGYWGLSLVPLLVARKAMVAVSASDQVIRRGFEPPGETAHRMLKRLKNVETSLVHSPVSGTSVLAIARVPEQP
jgi:2-polyprenyl-3-methyl-5-hydroxy-6-metoxy-1,4-benzoquinol methylase